MLIEFFYPGNGPSLELSGPSDVFEEANRQFGRHVYDLQLISERPGPITSLSGLRVLPDRTIDDPIDAIDTLIVAGTIDPVRTASPALIDWLKRCSSSARRYGSVCTGAFFLGAAGLLDNKHVTTHWEFAPALAATFPRAIVEPDRIFVRDGSLFTSAGVTAGVDLALALVEEDFGPALALSIARWLVIYLRRPGGQSQFSVHLGAQIASRPRMQRIQQTIRDDPRPNLSVHNLAQQAAMSDRTFARVFRRETGMTPADFVEATRVDAARRLLEETDLPLKQIAPASGFATAAALRRAFRKRLGATPLVYRSRAGSSYRR
jgi:transcriptional regulator GlxA family with amidase domain